MQATPGNSLSAVCERQGRERTAVRWLLGIAGLLMACAGMAQTGGVEPGAGFRFVQVPDPVGAAPMRAAVFYPASEATVPGSVGPIEIAAQQNAAPRAGSFPLVLLSHGNGASLFSHHDTATYLARRGYIVAAIEHGGDNFRDDSGLGTDRVWAGRSLQLSALLDQLLGGPPFASAIDPQKIGVAGFSAGGYTALLMLGAKPKFELLKSYCERWSPSVLCAGDGKVARSTPPLAAHEDSRVLAALVMSPVAAFFDRDSLSEVKRPVYLMAAAADTVLPLNANALVVKNSLPSPPTYLEFPDAGHFVFLAPCTAAQKAMAAALCNDQAGVDRKALHDMLNREAFRFFESQLTASGRSHTGKQPSRQADK